MEPPRHEGTPNPYGQAGWLSRLGFRWAQPLVEQGWKRPLCSNDLYDPLEVDSPTHCCSILKREWKKELAKQKHGGKPSLFRAVCKTVAPTYMSVGILCLLQRVSQMAQPVLFSYLLTYFSDDGGGIQKGKAWLCAMVIALCVFLDSVLVPFTFYQFHRAALQARSSVAALLYRKLLVMSRGALHGYSRGQIIEFLSTDMQRMSAIVWFGHEIWLTPLCAIFTVYVIFQYLGFTSLLGILIAVVLVPLTGHMGQKISQFRQKQRGKTDRRVGFMTELLSAMRLIKLLGWEEPLTNLVTDIRKDELKFKWAKTLWEGIMSEFTQFSCRLVQVITISTYVISGHVMSAATIFPALMVFSSLQNRILQYTPVWYLVWLQCQASIQKIEGILLAEEVSNTPLNENTQVMESMNKEIPSVSLSKVSTKWDSAQDKLALKYAYGTFKEQQLILVTGQVGSGKSALLLAILGELPVVQGQLATTGKLSYVGQQSWVFPSTIRQNILGGQSMERHKYEQVLDVTALTEDLKNLPLGDLTRVGESGVTLSGGQKARLNLARAVYHEADIYLIDDPFSAVDAKVGREIFNKCIGSYLRNKLRIVVTHQHQYFKYADTMLVMKDGKIEAQGTYEELVTSGVDLSSVGVESDDKHSCDDDLGSMEYHQCTKQQHNMEDDFSGTLAWKANRSDRISPKLILEYFQHGGHWLTLTSVLLVFVLAQVFHNLSDWWIAKWSSISKHGGKEGVLSVTQSMWLHLVLSAILVFLGFARVVFFQRICHNAARSLHNKMVTALMRSPISFFDQSSIGWLMSHFSHAIQHIDLNVPKTIPGLLQMLILVIGSVVVVVWYTPIVLIPACPLVVGLMYIHQHFSCTDHQLLKIDAACKIPYMNYISSTVLGMDTLRAHRLQSKCIRDFDLHAELFFSGWMTRMAVHNWMFVSANCVAAVFVITSVFGCMLAGKDLAASEVGLIMTTVVPLLAILGELAMRFSLSQSVYYESRRVFEITKLPPEYPIVSNLKPSKDWPYEGTICFQDVTFRYTSESPIILKNISFSIQPGEKVGIVGRTAAGKSSLVQVLCHLTKYEGQVLIDGIDISRLALQDLRTRIAVIPQDPVLFSCSIRQNIDPGGQHPDNLLWETLEKVTLDEVVSKLENGLDSHVLDGGENFSVGERQLFCLARVILRNSKVLVLDEATSSLDPRTEELIWEVVQQKFHSSTVLTISHRLSTVMTADRIMVLDGGEIMEFDSPAKLLQNQQSHLYRLVEQTGKSQQHYLMKMAGIHKH